MIKFITFIIISQLPKNIQLRGDNMEEKLIKHSEIKTVEDYKLYKKQKNKAYYEKNKDKIKAKYEAKKNQQ